MLTENEKARVRWACRRGMLELDTMIMPFFEHCFDDLSKSEQQDFIELLQSDDPLLFTWLMKQGQSEKPNIAAMVNKIVIYQRSKQS